MSMRPAWWGAALAALVAGGAGCKGPVEGGAPGALLAPPRAIPVPTTVSPELQRLIAKPVDFILEARTPEEWRALQKEYDESTAAGACLLASRLKVTATETEAGGVRAFLVEPRAVAPENRRRLLVHLHGGAYVFNGGDAAPYEAILVADHTKTAVLSVDYRRPPEHPFPAALEDAVAAWRDVLRTHDPARTALFGTSAGGGLTMATVMRLRELGLPLPGALFLGTPWTDLSKRGDSYFTLAGIDNELDTYDGGLEAAAKLHAAGRSLTDPWISPVYGDARGFPPTILISGTRDLLLSCTVRAHRKLRQAGVEAELHVFEGQSHAQYLIGHPSPESEDAMTEVARFFDRHLRR